MTQDNKPCEICYGIREAAWTVIYAVGLIGYGALLYHVFVIGGF